MSLAKQIESQKQVGISTEESTTEEDESTSDSQQATSTDSNE